MSAVVTVHSPHREAPQPESQSALASLVWFSCAQSAEPIMLKGILFAVRPGIHAFTEPTQLKPGGLHHSKDC